jgi:molecular chaperone GrpE
VSEARRDGSHGPVPGDPATDRPGAGAPPPSEPEAPEAPDVTEGQETLELDGEEAGEPAAEREPDERERWEAEVERVTQERDQYIEALQRLKAEFDNFRKRSERERQANSAAAARELVRDLLPVMDNLERAVAALDEHGEAASGVEMVRAQLAGVLAGQGVEEIDALGCEFDPNVHDAIAQLPADDRPAGTVIEVVTKGYRQAQTVLRPTKVVVAAEAR